jgi:hypothetical protein
VANIHWPLSEVIEVGAVCPPAGAIAGQRTPIAKAAIRKGVFIVFCVQSKNKVGGRRRCRGSYFDTAE